MTIVAHGCIWILSSKLHTLDRDLNILGENDYLHFTVFKLCKKNYDNNEHTFDSISRIKNVINRKRKIMV